MKAVKRRLIMFFLSLGIFIVLAIASLILLLLNIEIPLVYTILLFVVLTVLAILSAFLLIRYSSQKNMNDNLINENRFNLHRENTFYNNFYFTDKLSKKWSRWSQDSGYAIVFSCIRTSGAQTNNHDKNADLNGAISDYISKRLDGKRGRSRDSFYCYSRGLFVIYTRGNEAYLNSLLTDLESNIYRISRENDFRLYIQPYFGICIHKPDDNKQIYELINHALIAREVAEKNFESVIYFNEEMLEMKFDEEIAELSEAIDRGEFVVFYQAKYSLNEKKFVSSEALVRWISPKYGLISPMRFIDKAENGGLIHKIDMFVFEQVCKNLDESKRKGRRLLPVSVNFSLYEFYGQNFIDDLISMIEKYKVDPSLLELEVTESTTGVNTFLSISILKKLKEYGIRILMDDFGVGYSNFNNLKNMPFDAIKIDKSFIDNIVDDDKSRQIVKFMVEFIKETGMEAIAEGVDNQKQVDILKKFKCDTIQGYYYSRPIPYQDYESLLLNNRFEKKED